MSIHSHFNKINNNKENWDKGYYNCIPFLGMDRLTSFIPGLEKSTYYLLTASTGIGKSKFSRFLFAHSPYEYIRTNPNSPVKFKVLFFSLEESKESFINSEISRHLYLKYNVRLSKRQLMSIGEKNTISRENIELIQKSKDDLAQFFDCIEVIDDVRNPYGIYRRCRNYLESRGKITYKHLIKSDGSKVKDAEGNIKEYFDEYIPYDPYEYTIIIVDHAALLIPEPNMGIRTVKESISDLSSRRFLELRDRYQATLVLVQQQNAETDKQIAYFKGKPDLHNEPTLSNLGEHKLTQQDCNIAMGLYSPSRFDTKKYKGYSMQRLDHKFRSVSILKNRDGISDGHLGMYFDGACGIFKELPSIDDREGLENAYNLISKNKY